MVGDPFIYLFLHWSPSCDCFLCCDPFLLLFFLMLGFIPITVFYILGFIPMTVFMLGLIPMAVFMLGFIPMAVFCVWGSFM